MFNEEAADQRGKGENKMKHFRALRSLVFFGGVLLAAGLIATETRAATEIQLSRGQTVYVPIYSHIYSGNRERPFLLAATLSIRNTDPDHQITILSVDYYDSNGKLLKHYLKQPIQLNTIASIRYIIRESNKSGGSGGKLYCTLEIKIGSQ